MQFTGMQKKAVKERNRDILVSAGAGAGKTRVLVSRIADLLTDPAFPLSADEILVMTFTNAAAQEMKERIARELNERLQKNPEDKNLRRQIRLIRQADISTVHSFCSRLLRKHFQEAGLDPSFRIGEEGEMQLLKHQAMEEILEDAYIRADQEFLLLVEAFAPGKDDWILEDMVQKFYGFVRGFPDPEGWLGRQREKAEALCDPAAFEYCLPVTRLLEKTKEQIESLALEMEAFVGQMLCDQDLHGFEDVTDALTLSDIPERYAGLLLADAKILKELSSLTTYEDYYRYLGQLQLPDLPRGSRREERSADYLEDIKELHRKIRADLSDLQDVDFRYSSGDICAENTELLPYLYSMTDLVLRYESLYSHMKQEQNVYDFDDLEHLTLKMLVKEYDEKGEPVPSETARTLSRKYKEIFVDEYQDTSLVQETILKVLHHDAEHGSAEVKKNSCGSGNHLFAVGDVKQSIYRFRQARPDLFLERQCRYEQNKEELARNGHNQDKETGMTREQDSCGMNIELTDNFRSAPDILFLCNHIFGALMDENFGGLKYDERHSLRSGPGGPMEKFDESSEILFLMEDEEKDQLTWEYDALYAETAMIADRAKKLLDEGYHYGDMVILLRSASWRAETMAEYLKQMDIPAECESRMGYFHTREVKVILNYLSLIDNIYQDIPMASVLLSSIGGFTEEELVCLKTQIEIPMRKEYSLYELMELYVDTGDDRELAERFAEFLVQLEGFRKQKKEIPLHKLIWNIYQKTGFYYHVLLMSDGEKRRENLNMLLKKAEDYEKTVFKGLFYFIRYIDQLKSYEVELGQAGTDSDNEDKLRIMTIHKSKGLEFPVVFVSGLSVQFNFTDTNQSFLYHPDLGIGIEAVDLKHRIHHPSMMKNMLKEQMRRETLEEELRILYVAMTRAQRKLILTGVINENMLEKHRTNPLKLYNKMKARSYMDWILPLIMREELAGYVKRVHLRQLDTVTSSKTAVSCLLTLEDYIKDISLPEDSSPVEKAFSHVYSYDGLTAFKRKYSVSELKKLAMMAPHEDSGETDIQYNKDLKETCDVTRIPVPDFLLKTKEMAPTDRGTIVHKIMELLPFEKIHDKETLHDALGKVIHEYEPAGKISIEEVIRGAEAFLFSEEGCRIRQMASRGCFYKEVPFTISIPASLVEKGLPIEENVIVQGVIDAYGDTGEDLWLIDYKTDRIKKGQEQILLDRYQKQMLYYKTALEMLIKKPVAKTYIYSFALCRFIPL